MLRHASQSLYLGSDRCPVDRARTAPAAAEAGRTSALGGSAGGRQRPAVCAAHGCPWRSIPHDLPPWSTVWTYFRQWRDDGTLDRLHDQLRDQVRVAAGRDPQPSAVILDSQSVKTTEKGGRAASTLARRYGTQTPSCRRYPGIDPRGGGPSGQRAGSGRGQAGAGATHRPDATPAAHLGRCGVWRQAGGLGAAGGGLGAGGGGQATEAPRPSRCCRTAGSWSAPSPGSGKCRRLSKDYEHLISSSVAMIRLAMIRLMTNRLARAR